MSTCQWNLRKTQIKNGLQIDYCNKSANHFVSMSVSTFQWGKYERKRKYILLDKTTMLQVGFG